MKGGTKPKRKFEHVDSGSVVYHVLYGESTVFEVLEDSFSIRNKVGELWMTKEGYPVGANRTDYEGPVIFWNPVKLPSIEEDVPPFNLVQLLKQNLVPEAFIPEQENPCIYLQHSEAGKTFLWRRRATVYEEWLTVYFTDKQAVDFVVEQLNEYCVTREELLKAYKELGWL